MPDRFSCLNRLEARLNEGGHADDEEAEKRQGDQHEQGQLPVYGAHHGDAEAEDQGGLDNAANAVGEEDAHRVEVVGGAGHQVAGVMSLEERQRHAQEVGEIGRADVVFDPCGGVAEQTPHGVSADGDDSGENENPHPVPGYRAQGVGLGGEGGGGVQRVHRPAEQERNAGGGGLSQGDGCHPKGYTPPIGTGVVGEGSQHAVKGRRCRPARGKRMAGRAGCAPRRRPDD